ncbi:MAG: hypothetical protein EA385_03925 [Salinarimonadaceae bacterium]|nr:MAG: hypothetical protein EA385_03925 [Salinarimonadaceae bacterium]
MHGVVVFEKDEAIEDSTTLDLRLDDEQIMGEIEVVQGVFDNPVIRVRAAIDIAIASDDVSR